MTLPTHENDSPALQALLAQHSKMLLAFEAMQMSARESKAALECAQAELGQLSEMFPTQNAALDAAAAAEEAGVEAQDAPVHEALGMLQTDVASVRHDLAHLQEDAVAKTRELTNHVDCMRTQVDAQHSKLMELLACRQSLLGRHASLDAEDAQQQQQHQGGAGEHFVVQRQLDALQKLIDEENESARLLQQENDSLSARLEAISRENYAAGSMSEEVKKLADQLRHQRNHLSPHTAHIHAQQEHTQPLEAHDARIKLPLSDSIRHSEIESTLGLSVSEPFRPDLAELQSPISNSLKHAQKASQLDLSVSEQPSKMVFDSQFVDDVILQAQMIDKSRQPEPVVLESASVAVAKMFVQRHQSGEVESVVPSETALVGEFRDVLVEATKNDEEFEGLSLLRDDYYPSSLARDPKTDREPSNVIYLDGDRKRKFKKPREVSLVADYIRRFLTTKYYDLDRPLKEQSQAVELLMRKLMIVFPHGDWTPYIVKSLIREKTKKKRSSAAAAMTMTMTPSIGGGGESAAAAAASKRRRLSGEHSSVLQLSSNGSGGVGRVPDHQVPPLWAAELFAKVDQNCAAVANLRLRRQNSRLAQLGNDALRPLLKQRAGQLDCIALAPEMVSPPSLLHKHELVAKVGCTPDTIAQGGAFPDTMTAATQMSHDQVLQLMRFYNDDMNIVASDDLDTRIHKLLAWLRE